MTYPLDQVLANIQNSILAVLLSGAVINLGYFLFYGEAIRLGFRDKTHAVPVFANMYFFGHDLIFVFLFQRWFYEIDCWLFRAFWFGIVVFTLLEVVVHYQTLRYSHRELFPRLTYRQYLFAYAGMQLAIGVLFWFIYTQIDDYLYLISFTSTIIVSVAFMLPLLHARGNQKGQSRLLAASLIVSTIGFFFLFLPVMSCYFASWPYRIMGVATLVVAVIYMGCLSRYPAYESGGAGQNPGNEPLID
jgi:hypothetical protein